MDATSQQLIKALQIEALPPEEQAEVVEKFADTLFQAVLVRGIALLTEAQKNALDAEFKKHPDGANGTRDVLMDFLMANIPDFSSVVDEETKRLYERIALLRAK